LFVASCSNAKVAQQRELATTESEVVVPKLWDAEQLATWATPIAGLGCGPSYVSEADYYAAPVDNLRTYPVYHPRFEPAGYREWMLAQGPQPLIEPSKLKTRAEWIAAGRGVFEQLDTASSRTDDPAVLAYFGDAATIDAHRDASHDVIDRDGVLLDYRWVVERDGKLAISFTSCAGCHTRLMSDGSLLEGAPCNFDLADSPASQAMLDKLRISEKPGEDFYAQYGVPWLADDPHARFKTMPPEELGAFFGRDSGAPPGTTFARFNGSPLSPTRMADLRGVRDRRYLDATGTHKNRGPEDIARYGILVEFADRGVFGPHHMLPEKAMAIPLRPPDEAMYAMALYIDSLEPAPSPHPFDELAARGQHVFEREDCAECHPPPLYTNNELVELERIGTDPTLALATRKGTGRYKVPSLRGLWYRGLFEHNGSVASLEDWFDVARLEPDYVPTGWRGYGVEHRAVPGHDFGLDLTADDKRALIAFLNTL
jgi:mono/diheme cytochrome c family protein